MSKNDNIKTRIEEILAADFDGTDWFLVEVKVLPNKNVQVFVDRDTDFNIADCAAINRKLAHQLNEEMDFSTQFGMEVSSPGIERPFQFLRQYKKNAGRNVKVETTNGKKTEGKLISADEEKIILETAGTKKNTKQPIEISFSTIKQTKVIITF